MRIHFNSTLFASFLSFCFSLSSPAECLPFTEAAQHIGETQCVSGTVLRVDREQSGLTELRFCEGSGQCAFTAVVCSEDVKRVGDLRKLEGKSIEVHGMLEALEGRTQIVVHHSRQLRPQLAEETSLPALLKEYDVDEKGHCSAGKFNHPKAARKTTRKKQAPTLPVDVPVDAELGELPSR
ncbi:MAG: hypothetical protein NVS1B11_03120 [Terriglobales bacterium]